MTAFHLLTPSTCSVGPKDRVGGGQGRRAAERVSLARGKDWAPDRVTPGAGGVGHKWLVEQEGISRSKQSSLLAHPAALPFPQPWKVSSQSPRDGVGVVVRTPSRLLET